MSEKHIIKLADGTEYTADLNGNNYVIDKDVREHFTDTNIASATVDGISKGILILDSVRCGSPFARSRESPGVT